MLRALVVAVFLLVVAAPAARADVPWLCSPSLASDPCRGDLTTREFQPDGSSSVVHVAVAAKAKVDCFYVYPTVSNQPGPNATPTPDPEVQSIATYQAQRFSAGCRVFAPLYRQATAAAVSVASQTHDTTPYETALGDVRAAFQEYLRTENHGRGFVLIGHSQGSRMLRAVLHRDVDGVPAVRARLVSAIIPGANAVEGEFPHVPACTAAAQTGCVISYSTFNETPPANARFGRTDTDPVGNALGLPGGPVQCTNPAALDGSGGAFRSLVPSKPFAPGVIAALLVRLYGGPPPSADTPWLVPQDHYTGRCVTENGARVLHVDPVGAARKLTPSPDQTWGTHLVDVNLPLGNLLSIVGAETAAYTRATAPTRVRLRARRAGRGRRDLLATVLAAPGTRLRVTLARGRRVVATRRLVAVGGAGVTRLRFRVRRAGRYVVTARPVAGGAPVRSPARRITLR